MRKAVLLIVFGVALCQAQAPGVDWMQRYGSSGLNLFRSLIQTQDGGFLIGGWSNGGIEDVKTQPCVGFNPDYWVVKVDQNGAVEWDKTIGGGTTSPFDELTGELLTKVRQTADGGYLIGGHSDSPILGDKTEPTYGGLDFWVVRLDAAGNLIWQKDVGGLERDELFALENTPDGGCIVGGQSQSGVSGNKTEASRGGKDYWVVKLDGSGNIEWQKTIGGSGTDILSSILVLDDGYLLAGYSTSNISGEKTDNAKGGADYWILKTDWSGNIVWQKTIGGNDGDLLYSAAKIPGGFVLAGQSYSGILYDKTTPAYGGGDFWVVKTNLIGEVIWDNTFGGSAYEALIDVKIVADGGLILVGNSESSVSGDVIEVNQGDYDSWIVRTDETGNLLWQNSIGGDGADGFNQVLALADGSFLLGGQTGSSLSGEITDPGNGYDYWLVKTQPENLAAPEIQPKAFMVYPNPATESVSIRFAESVNSAEIKIFNALSQQLSVQVFENVSDVVVALPEPEGVYFLQLNADDKINTVKIIKR